MKDVRFMDSSLDDLRISRQVRGVREAGFEALFLADTSIIASRGENRAIGNRDMYLVGAGWRRRFVLRVNSKRAENCT